LSGRAEQAGTDCLFRREWREEEEDDDRGATCASQKQPAVEIQGMQGLSHVHVVCEAPAKTVFGELLKREVTSRTRGGVAWSVAESFGESESDSEGAEECAAPHIVRLRIMSDAERREFGKGFVIDFRKGRRGVSVLIEAASDRWMLNALTRFLKECKFANKYVAVAAENRKIVSSESNFDHVCPSLSQGSLKTGPLFRKKGKSLFL